MNQGRIIVITGSPGTGKTTTASIVAKESDTVSYTHLDVYKRQTHPILLKIVWAIFCGLTGKLFFSLLYVPSHATIKTAFATTGCQIEPVGW